MTSHEWFVEHRVDYVTRTLDPDDVPFGHLAQCDGCAGGRKDRRTSPDSR
jgi:hypothetical protein